MKYTEANIHRRINAKNNARILYTYSGMSLGKIINRDTDLYNSTRLMLRPDQVHEPRNQELVPKSWWSGTIASNH